MTVPAVPPEDPAAARAARDARLTQLLTDVEERLAAETAKTQPSP